jgi:hypothetical protein
VLGPQTMLETILEEPSQHGTLAVMRFVSSLTLVAVLGCGQDVTNPHSTRDPTSGVTVVSGTTGEATDPVVSDTSTTGLVPTASDAGIGTPDVVDAAAQRTPCKPGPGTTGNPQTVVEVVQLINGLPHPVTIMCLLESLDRPLRILAASSFISAQPAFGVDNPRIFILGGGISMSVVPYGDSRNLLEMGELTSNTESIKAELEFPIHEPLSPEAAFTHIHSESFEGTVCAGCHGGETLVEDYPVAGAYNSIAYRPLPVYEVNFDYVHYQFETCDESLEPERCAFYDALFAHGEVLPDHFPEDMPLFQ